VLTLCDQLQFSKHRHPGRGGAPAKVTAALPLRCSALTQMVVDILHENSDLTSERSVVKMKTTNSLRVRASRFFSDRYAYRERPEYLIELAAFGIIVITVTLSLANAMATTLK
jgi:hypothetical protein